MAHVKMYVDRVYLLVSYVFGSSFVPCARHLPRFFGPHVVASGLCAAPNVGRAVRTFGAQTKPRRHTVRGGRSDGPLSQEYCLFDHTDTTGVLVDWVTNGLENTARSRGLWFSYYTNGPNDWHLLSCSPCLPNARTVSIVVSTLSWSRSKVSVWHMHNHLYSVVLLFCFVVLMLHSPA
jgi:hypothetical protein